MLENIFIGSFIKALIQQGGQLRKVPLPIETSNWLHTVHFSFPAKNEIFYGLGSDRNEKLAYIKAVVCNDNDIGAQQSQLN